MTTAIYQATAEQARTLTDRIKVGVEAVWQLIAEAYTSRAYIALGYANWDDYCTREFGTSRLRLPREERPETVGSLRDAGLSIPAIASATGLGYGTVQRELASGYPSGQPDDPESEWTDDEPALTEEECEALDQIGMTPEETDRALRLADLTDNEFEQAITVARKDGDLSAEHLDAVITDIPTPPRITGTDGKSYPAPKPQAKPAAPKRKPLPDAFWKSTFDLGKEVERLTRLAADDRFKKNADQIQQANLHDLIRARDGLQSVIDQLT